MYAHAHNTFQYTARGERGEVEGEGVGKGDGKGKRPRRGKGGGKGEGKGEGGGGGKEVYEDLKQRRDEGEDSEEGLRRRIGQR